MAYALIASVVLQTISFLRMFDGRLLKSLIVIWLVRRSRTKTPGQSPVPTIQLSRVEVDESYFEVSMPSSVKVSHIPATSPLFSRKPFPLERRSPEEERAGGSSTGGEEARSTLSSPPVAFSPHGWHPEFAPMYEEGAAWKEPAPINDAMYRNHMLHRSYSQPMLQPVASHPQYLDEPHAHPQFSSFLSPNNSNGYYAPNEWQQQFVSKPRSFSVGTYPIATPQMPGLVPSTPSDGYTDCNFYSPLPYRRASLPYSYQSEQSSFPPHPHQQPGLDYVQEGAAVMSNERRFSHCSGMSSESPPSSSHSSNAAAGSGGDATMVTTGMNPEECQIPEYGSGLGFEPSVYATYAY